MSVPLYKNIELHLPASHHKKQKSAPIQKSERFCYLSCQISLVADIRQQCNVSCTLDCSCQFTLMECTSASNSAGQNLCTFSHALLELGNVLVVDTLNAIYTEHTNLFAGAFAATLRSFSLHDVFILLSAMRYFFGFDQKGTSPSLRISSKSPRSPSCIAPGALFAAGACGAGCAAGC